MKGTTYANNKDFTRRNLYIHQVNSKRLDIEAARLRTDASQVLNEALASYFLHKEGERNV